MCGDEKEQELRPQFYYMTATFLFIHICDMI